MKSFFSSTVALISSGSLFLVYTASGAPTLTKLLDFDNRSGMQSAQGAYDSPLLLGSTLWFTTAAGGSTSFGTFCSFDLTTSALNIRLQLNNATGNTPQGTPVFDDGRIYYSTTRGGTGDRGTINFWDTANNTNTVIWNSPTNENNNPNTVPGNVAIIDRGTDGKDIYFLTGGGGLDSPNGTIQRYNSLTGLVTQIHAFEASPDGRQPFKGFTVVGTKLYFTTFTGGNTSPSGDPTGSASSGMGTLCELDVTTSGSEAYRVLARLEKGTGSTRFPAHNPYYRAADNSLYFGCTGTNARPGALFKYDLTTGVFETLYELVGDQGSTAPVRWPDGKNIYGSLIEWNRALYFCTFSGGANSTTAGTVNRFNLDTRTHEVLYNLSSVAGDNFGGGVRGGFVPNGSLTEPAFYLLTRIGGLYNHGTILKLNLDLPVSDSAYTTWLANYPGLSGADSVPNADADKDGIPNKVEFAYGTSPDTGSGNGLSTVVPNETGLEVRWTAATAGGIQYVVKGSPTLGAAPSPWTPVTQAQEVMAEPDIPLAPGFERRRVVIPIGEASGFFRVEAEIPSTALP